MDANFGFQKIVNDMNMELVIGKILKVTAFKYYDNLGGIHSCFFFKAGNFLVIPPGKFFSEEANDFLAHLNPAQYSFFRGKIITFYQFSEKFPVLAANHLCAN